MSLASVVGGIFSSVNGLPLHPLIVHVVVVLLPLSALGAVLIALVPRWSRQFGVLVWIGGFVSTGAAWVAGQSGKELARTTGVPPAHLEYGEQVKYYAAGLTALAFVLWVIDRRAGQRGTVTKLLAAAVIVAAIAACWATFRAGDTGARAVWASVN